MAAKDSFVGKGVGNIIELYTIPSTDFIREIIIEQNRTKTFNGLVAIRFAPESKGYLHIGYAKSVYLNFGIAAQYGGTCNMLFF